MHDRLERIESLKAGSLSGIATGIAYGAFLALDLLRVNRHSGSLTSLAVEAAIAGASGFLFGVTYRYIIRTDRNDHLNSGAVLAFGLVRGLARVNTRDLDLDIAQIATDVTTLSESILLFTLSRYTIDYALNLRWVSPFKCSSDPNEEQPIDPTSN